MVLYYISKKINANRKINTNSQVDSQIKKCMSQ